MAGSGQNRGELDQFQKVFFEECSELLGNLDDQFAMLGENPSDRETLNAVFRAVHSIKAGAGAFGFSDLVAFAHEFEATLDALRDGRIANTERITALLVRAGDVLAHLIEAVQKGRKAEAGYGDEVAAELAALLGAPVQSANRNEGMPVEGVTTSGPRKVVIRFRPHAEMFRHANEPLLLFRELRGLGSLSVTCDFQGLPAFGELDPEEAYLAWSLEIETAESLVRLREVFEFVEDDCALDFEELLPSPDTQHKVSLTPTNGDGAAELGSEGTPGTGQRGGSMGSIRVDLARIDRLVNMVGELVITQAMLAQEIDDQAQLNGRQTIRRHEELAMLTRELQECVMAIRMQPVKSVFARMPRLVRDVAAKLEKSIRLVTSGEQTEVDKTVIEELADPLTHMIRNAIDHGIESPAARIAAGKPETGTIELSAAHAGSNILIHVADDGGGIDRERLLAKAVAKGIVPAGASLTEEEIDELIFSPGFSTAEKVTDVSGRGVGMDVVRRNIVNLGGRIQVSSVHGRGTRFTLVIPLTLAVLDGMIVQVGAERYILPLTSILESYRPDPRHIRAVTGGMNVAAIRGEYIRLVHLHEIFEVPDAVTDPAQGIVVLVETTQGGKIGIVVDDLVGQQQVVIKSLTDNFDPVDGVSGATILGNGKVALIVDIEQMSAMAAHRSGGRGRTAQTSTLPAIDVAA
ncbi:MAG: chemotaxis protein CheA [Proteobacteria bacterium]|nr:chemotaxis protein CheA [Pseudomonadota bacterium]